MPNQREANSTVCFCRRIELISGMVLSASADHVTSSDGNAEAVGWRLLHRSVYVRQASSFLSTRRALWLERDDCHTHTFYCQSGVRTTQLIFGLTLAGWQSAQLRNYDGSWVEWSHLADDSEICVGS